MHVVAIRGESEYKRSIYTHICVSHTAYIYTQLLGCVYLPIGKNEIKLPVGGVVGAVYREMDVEYPLELAARAYTTAPSMQLRLLFE